MNLKPFIFLLSQCLYLQATGLSSRTDMGWWLWLQLYMCWCHYRKIYL